MAWLHEEISAARQLYEGDGKSAAVVAAEMTKSLGRTITRNSIIGLAHRQG